MGCNKEGIVFFNQNQQMIAQKNHMIRALIKPEGTMIVVDFARFYRFRGAADPQFGIDPYGYVYDGK